MSAASDMRKTDEARRLLLLERLPAIAWTTDRELRFTSTTGEGVGIRVGSSLHEFFQTTDETHFVIAAHRRALQGERVSYDLTFQGRVFRCTVEPLRSDRGEVVGCVGVALDVTEHAETELALRESERRLRRLVEANILGILFWSRDGRVLDANQAFLDLVGYSRDDLVSGRVSWAEMTPPEYRSLDDNAATEIEQTGTCRPYEKEYIARDGTHIPVLIGAASLDESPRSIERGVAFVLDLREQVRLRSARNELLARERQTRRETEEANVRLVLVAEAGKMLARSLHDRDTLGLLARLYVPSLADWCVIVSRAESDGDERYAVAAHADPTRHDLVERICALAPQLASSEHIARVFRSGEASLHSDATTDGRGPIVGSGNVALEQLVAALGASSLLFVPVAGREQVEAVAMLVSTADPRRYTSADIMLAEEFANRAASSLENARLFSDAIAAVRTRDEFLSVAAHELRTPLTALLLRAQLLQRALASDDKPTQHMANALEEESRRLVRLVDSLLEVSRGATGPMAPRRERLELVEVVRNVVSALAPELTKAACVVRLDAQSEVLGCWDRTRLEQLVTNLLANAMKFGRGRPIDVRIDTGSEQEARIAIRDHGIGIAHEEQGRIFGRFERAVSARHFGGFGLGLYVSAQIARAHGGSLEVESEPGRGACFTVILPRNDECL
jgi:PAS domain S-box-containing protein